MDWNSLLSAIVGGLLTVIPVLITIRNQSTERDKDRQEQRREAKTQLALELLRNDIKVVEDGIDNELKLVVLYANLRISKEGKELSEAEMGEEIDWRRSATHTRATQLREVKPIAEKIARSLGNEFFAQYDKFDDEIGNYLNYLIHSRNFIPQEAVKLQTEAAKSAAPLHSMMNDKLVSIRDTSA
jgi:hypothetical protein